MSLDVKNIQGGDTGNVQNGRVSVMSGRAGSPVVDKNQTIEPNGYSEYPISGFDDLEIRLDDVRYYTGDTVA